MRIFDESSIYQGLCQRLQLGPKCGVTAAHNLNAWADVAPTENMEKYRPGEHDKNTKLRLSIRLYL